MDHVALGESKRSFLSRPPQLRFFSSPGGVKVNYAQTDGTPGAQDKEKNMNQAVQMYDFETEPEETLMIRSTARRLGEGRRTSTL